MKTLLSKLFVLLGAMTPVVSFAQAPDFDYFNAGLDAIGVMVTKLIPILIAVGLLFFIWGLVQFMMSGGDETAKTKAKAHMVWGVIALFVMVSVWGLVGLLGKLTGIKATSTIETPTVEL